MPQFAQVTECEMSWIKMKCGQTLSTNLCTLIQVSDPLIDVAKPRRWHGNCEEFGSLHQDVSIKLWPPSTNTSHYRTCVCVWGLGILPTGHEQLWKLITNHEFLGYPVFKKNYPGGFNTPDYVWQWRWRQWNQQPVTCLFGGLNSQSSSNMPFMSTQYQCLLANTHVWGKFQHFFTVV